MSLIGTITPQELTISKNVSANTEEYSTYTPPAGSTVVIKNFTAESPFNRATVCKVIWKFNHGSESEEILWSIRGNGISPKYITIPSSDTDGTRELAITCDNGEDYSIIMAAFATIEVIEH